MAEYVTIDMGTTNTRLSLVKDRQVVETLRYPIGARACMEDPQLLTKTLQQGISQLLLRPEAVGVKRILASGMITCEYGLCHLPHLHTPAGLPELHSAMQEVLLPEISNLPFVFMRGVRTGTTPENTDFMRGEETELFGISNGEEGIYVLPGSHSKILTTDANCRITGIRTLLTGEMVAALSGHTILKSAVDLATGKLEESYLYKGFLDCQERGINEALFQVRVLKNACGGNEDQVYSYFLGIVLCGEILQILKLQPRAVTVGGTQVLKEATVYLLQKLSDAQIISIPDAVVRNAPALGMVKIFEYPNCP